MQYLSLTATLLTTRQMISTKNNTDT